MIQPPRDPSDRDVVLAIDVGGLLVKTAAVGPGLLEVRRIPTTTTDEPWGIERLEGIAAELHATAVAGGRVPAALVVAVPGQVDEYHGAVQYSATLPWHDVPVADRLAEVVDGEVTVRHAARVGALAESNLGAAAGEGTMLFVSLGAQVVAAGAQSGVVVADHVGAGDIGGMRIRSGPGEGRTLDEFASAGAIARRYAAGTETDPGIVDAADVHRLITTDPVAKLIWDEAVDALADGLEWAAMLYAPQTVVIGGGMVNAGDDLMEPLIAGVTRRLGSSAAPRIMTGTFGDDAGWVGAAFAAWKKARWSQDTLRAILAGRFDLGG